MGRVARLVVGYGLMVAGVLIAAWGVVVTGMGGDSGTPGHPFAAVGILILAVGVGAVVGALFVLLGGRPPRRSVGSS